MTHEQLMKWAKNVHERDISDEANHFASDAESIMSLPDGVDIGGWKASLEIAFEAGRMCEKFCDEE